MKSIVRNIRIARICGVIAAVAGLIAVGGAAQAAPLGLTTGDIVSQLEWDAFQSNGDGGSFVSATQALGVDGAITSVTTQGPVTDPVTGVSLRLDGTAVSSSFACFANCATPGSEIVLVVVEYASSGGGGPDLTLTENAAVILEAVFTTNFQVGGLVDLSAPLNFQVQQIVANDITITGGDTNLVNALGGVGGMATLKLTGTIFDFVPGLATILADQDPLNDDFTFSGGGIITVVSPSAFVPEPSTGLLVGLGLALIARRRTRI